MPEWSKLIQSRDGWIENKIFVKKENKNCRSWSNVNEKVIF